MVRPNRELFWASAVVLWADFSLLSKSVLSSPGSRTWWGVTVAVLVGGCFLFIQYHQPRSRRKKWEWYESQHPGQPQENWRDWAAHDMERRALDTEILCLSFSVFALVIEVIALLSVPNEGMF